MAKFVLLYNGGGMPEAEAEIAAVMKAWEAWYGDLGKALVDPGNPFSPVTKSIKSDGAVSDGPVGTMTSGYTIVEAGTQDEAVKLAQGSPMLQGGGDISVYETLDM